MSFVHFGGSKRRMRDLKGDMDRLFDEFFGEDGSLTNRGDVQARTSIEDKPGAYIVTVEMPGVKKEEIKISYKNERLYLTAEKKRVETDTVYLKDERQFGHVARSLDIPMEILSDQIEAEFTDGILTVILPKSKEEADPGIEVNIK